jgi:Tfp pilus assembly PilM family ATPase
MSYLESFNKYFPTPHYLEMSHAGVDISSSMVRMAEMVRTSKGLKLRSYAEEKLESTILPNQSLLSNKNLIDVLNKIQKEHNLKFVEVSIPEEKGYLFTIEVLDGTKEEIRTRIEMHIEENVPISIDDAVFDYHRIKKNNKTGMQFLAVSVVPLGIIEEYIALFESCKMIPISFLIENQALSRAIIKKGDKDSYLIVNVSHKNTILSVVSDETVQFTSTVGVGSEDFTRAIANKLSIEKEPARLLKYEKGFSREKDNQLVSDALIETSNILVEEIKKIFVYWSSINSFKNIKGSSFDLTNENPENLGGVKKVLIAGKEAGIIGFRDFLAISLKIPVEVANVWTNIMSFENEIPDISMKESLSYGTAFGLALLKDQ